MDLIFVGVSAAAIVAESYPAEALQVERATTGSSFGFPVGVRFSKENSETVQPFDMEELYDLIAQEHLLLDKIRKVESTKIARTNHKLEQLRLQRRRAELKNTLDAEMEEYLSTQKLELQREYEKWYEELRELESQQLNAELILRSAEGTEFAFPLAEIIYAYQPNQISIGKKFVLFFNPDQGFSSPKNRVKRIPQVGYSRQYSVP